MRTKAISWTKQHSLDEGVKTLTLQAGTQKEARLLTLLMDQSRKGNLGFFGPIIWAMFHEKATEKEVEQINKIFDKHEVDFQKWLETK